MPTRGWPAPLALVLVVLPFAAVPAAADPLTAVTCFSATGAAVSNPYTVDVGGQTATGYYAYPRTEPKAIVAVGHGWGGTAAGYRSIVNSLASKGALAVAMDFRGPQQDYKLFTGAEDTAAAVRDLAAQCGDRPVILWGVSMGGHISAWTVMTNPGLADYLVMDVGPANMPQLLATLVPGFGAAGAMNGLMSHSRPVEPAPCPDNPTFGTDTCTIGATALPKILDAYSGRPPTALVDTSAALNATAWAGSGLRWGYLVYASADTVVTPDHGLQMLANMRAQGVPATYYGAVYRGSPQTGPQVACAEDPTPTLEECQGNGYLGLAPAGHVRSGDAIVAALLSPGPMNQEEGLPVGLATPDHDPIGSSLQDAPATGVPEVDAALADVDDEAEGVLATVDRHFGPLYPAP